MTETTEVAVAPEPAEPTASGYLNRALDVLKKMGIFAGEQKTPPS